MFGNFLYFIVVLLIYSTYPVSEKTNFSGAETLILFFLLILAFTLFNRIQFSRLIHRVSRDPLARLNYKFDILITQHSVMAVVLFAVDIYVLNLPSFLSDINPFPMIPTFQAICFLLLFLLYLSIVWACAFDVQQRLAFTEMSRRAYVTANISFSAPILMPWLVLSGLVDIIDVLPFEPLKRFMASIEGQIFLFIVFLTGISVLGPAMIQKVWRCKPMESGFYRSRIESLCRRAGISLSNIVYWPIFGGQMITAGVMGLVGKFRYILVTEGLLRSLQPNEVDAVIAHEIGHVKKHHLLFYLIFLAGFMLLVFSTYGLANVIIQFSEVTYWIMNITGYNHFEVTSTLSNLVVILTFLVYFRYIFGYFMRNFERQADVYVYQLFDSSMPLVATLRKIARTSGQSPDKPNWHHFSIQERIDFLETCENDRRWIIRHNQRIRTGIGIYLLGICLIGGLGYGINYGHAGESIYAYYREKALVRAIEREPDNPDLYADLGDLYYRRKNYADTIRVYTQSLTISPYNPHVLNNLAWLLATCEDQRYRDPKQAVMLAERAVKLVLQSQILDTLAESYYADGDLDLAVMAAKRALDLAENNRTYFEKQLEKFLSIQKQQADEKHSDRKSIEPVPRPADAAY